MVVGFSVPLTGVTGDNLVIETHEGETPIAGSYNCRDAADSNVDCDIGPVSSIRFFPTDSCGSMRPIRRR